MRPRIEGYVSKKNIRRLLDNYHALASGDQLPADGPVNTGQKAYDGVSGGKLNKIMIDDAVNKLSPWMQTVVKCRWTRQLVLRDAVKVLGCSPKIYRHRCGLAVEQIYIEINGAAAGLVALYEKIDRG